MTSSVTDRVVVGLRYVSVALAVTGILVVFGGLGLTSTAEALISTALVAGIAFGLPAAVAVALSAWLDRQPVAGQLIREGRLHPHQEHLRAPFSESVWGYVLAIGCAAGAWGLRLVLDQVLPNYVPFITFFLAVAVSGWLAGFGPAMLATVLCALLARFHYMEPRNQFDLDQLQTAAALGVFVLVSIAIGVLTSTLRSALRRVEVLTARLNALESAESDRTTIQKR
jgi:hypothetical protein